MIFISCKEGLNRGNEQPQFVRYADEILNIVYEKYSVENENLLIENYPSKENTPVTYLNTEEKQSNKFAYLWPYSGTFSAVNALYFKTKNPKYLNLLQDKVLPGLEEYFDTERYPFAYASYINRASLSDRFYDDNIWIGIDFIEIYLHTNDPGYLEKAKDVWNFVYSGYDEKLGGGIYWVESNKVSKNTCSNAPAVVFALKLYQATNNNDYFEKAKNLYNWTKNHLQDKSDHIYYDNIHLDGNIDKHKYAYNSGQMLQSAALLYRITKEEVYLHDAKTLAKACYNYFFYDFTDGDLSFRMLKSGDVWFSAIMSRGFLELYAIDKDIKYMDAFIQNLNYAWLHMRDENGLFGTDWFGKKLTKEKWLLTQTAMIEMYMNFSNIDIE